MSLSSFPFSFAHPRSWWGGEHPRQEHQRPALESLWHDLDGGVPAQPLESESFAAHSILSPHLVPPLLFYP